MKPEEEWGNKHTWKNWVAKWGNRETLGKKNLRSRRLTEKANLQGEKMKRAKVQTQRGT